MTKTTIAAPVSATATAAEDARRADRAIARADEGATELRPLADWALVLVGGGEMSPDW